MANLMDLMIKIGAEDNASSVVKSVASTTKSVMKGAALAVGALATGIAAMTKVAVSAYADYEQLVGGVETLFKKSAGTVMGFAEIAFQTAGLSANEYMETVTSFSASLVSSLSGDTARAAELANLAITDMADNANKMGSDMASIQSVYAALAKQNYTLLDNLKIGYGGTKSEMLRLLADAEKLSGIKYDINNFSDLIEAIHVIQTEIGITGTTAEEAEKTISGSVAMMKSAWQNWLIGLGNNKADMRKLTQQLVDSAKIAAKNIFPVVKTVINSIGEVINEDLPGIVDNIAELISENLPGFVDAGVEMAIAIINGIISNIDKFIGAGIDIAIALGKGIVRAAGEIIKNVPQIVTEVKNAFNERLPELQEVGRSIVGSVQGWLDEHGIDINLSEVWEELEEFSPALSDLWDASKDTFGDIKNAFSDIVSGVIDWYNNNDTLKESLSGLWDELQTTGITALEKTAEKIRAVGDAFSWLAEEAQTDGTLLNTIFEGFGDTVTRNMERARLSTQLYNDLMRGDFSGAFVTACGIAGNYVGQLKDDVERAWDWLSQKTGETWDGISEKVSEAAGSIRSSIDPVMQRLKSGDYKGALDEFAQLWDDTMTGIADTVSQKFSSIRRDIDESMRNIKRTISEGISNFVEQAGIDLTPLSEKFTNVFDDIQLAVEKCVKVLKSAFNFEWKLPEIKVPEIQVTPGSAPFGLGGAGSPPKIDVLWHRKAYDNPFLLDSATIFGAAGGKLLGGGEGNGSEVIFGTDKLMNMIENAVGNVIGSGGMTIVQNINAVPQTPAEFASATLASFETARWAF